MLDARTANLLIDEYLRLAEQVGGGEGRALMERERKSVAGTERLITGALAAFSAPHSAVRGYLRFMLAKQHLALLPQELWATDLHRLLQVAEAYHTSTIAKERAINHVETLPAKPGIESANAIGTMAMGGYPRCEEGGEIRFDVPFGGRPQDAGKTWLRRARQKYAGLPPADDLDELNHGLAAMLIASLPPAN